MTDTQPGEESENISDRLPPELEAEWKALVQQEAEQQEYVPSPKGICHFYGGLLCTEREFLMQMRKHSFTNGVLGFLAGLTGSLALFHCTYYRLCHVPITLSSHIALVS